MGNVSCAHSQVSTPSRGRLVQWYCVALNTSVHDYENDLCAMRGMGNGSFRRPQRLGFNSSLWLSFL
jgi:uncharacterized protein with NRDE domain